MRDPAGLAPAIEAMLEAATGRAIRLAAPPEPLTGGLSAQLLLLRLGESREPLPADVVLRILAADSHPRREGVIQRAVARSGYPAPDVLLLDPTDANPLGHAYLVMTREPGRALFGGGSPIATFKAFRSVPGVLATLMADLHAIDASPVAQALQTAGVGDDELGAGDALQVIDDPIRRWFEANTPAVDGSVVCHGDLHALNVIVADGRHTVVDWELATIADPAFDVARTALILRAVPVEMSDRVRGLVQRFGRRSADQFVAAYAERRPLDRATVAAYEVLHAARIACRLAHRDPGVADPVLDAWAPTARYLEARVRELTGMASWRPLLV